MKLGEIKQRLIDQTSVFKSVKGVADLATAKTDRQRDTAYVLLSDSRANANEHAMLVRQELTVGIAVIMAIANHRDRRGEQGLDEIESARSEVMNALLGWQPNGATSMITYRRGILIQYTEQVLWWQDEFEVNKLITTRRELHE